MLHDTGAYMPWGVVMPYIAATTIPGPYVLPAYELDVAVAYTNKVPTTPVRGAGRPQAVFVMERLLDRAARELKIDAAELRRRNLIQPEQMPYKVGLTFRDGKPVVYDSGDYPAAFDKALGMSRYQEFPGRQKRAREEGRYFGIGIGSYVEGTGLGPFEGVRVAVQDDGSIAVQSGAAPQGQGHKTMLAQIVAEQLESRLNRSASRSVIPRLFPWVSVPSRAASPPMPGRPH
jgi:carbon-monoxide dehydrogenase large subunit